MFYQAVIKKSGGNVRKAMSGKRQLLIEIKGLDAQFVILNAIPLSPNMQLYIIFKNLDWMYYTHIEDKVMS